ncbi:hypothetical protein [Halocatena salina]|uniref:Uncharacterized protein n=1 Tax=Halocatena salina TaxID=2934340 RepID=A0A8U0A0T8_9EURY|nr:hypothetical protein [Halocatena salina]UPM41693.1 hypothetical protein MW046_06750 [Halocatena salina]
MSQTDRKHVQTELSEDEYESFREIAAERGMTVKEASHEALVRWVEQQRSPNPMDRAFTVLEEIDTDDLLSTAGTDARQESDVVAEWSGNDVSFTLAENPSDHQT